MRLGRICVSAEDRFSWLPILCYFAIWNSSGKMYSSEDITWCIQYFTTEENRGKKKKQKAKNKKNKQNCQKAIIVTILYGKKKREKNQTGK